MRMRIEITRAPIAAPLGPAAADGLGAWVEFRGVVRGEEAGEAIRALEYEAYQPMAELEMRRILEELAADRPCLAVEVVHRVGVVPVGDTAIAVGIAARHRAEALALMAQFMDRLKQDVPIWKVRALPATPVTGSPAPAIESTAVSGPVGAQRRGAADPGETPAGAAGGGAGGSSALPASPTAVIALLRALCRPLDVESADLPGSAGLVLREAVCAPEDQPAFDRSSVDGYAVRLDDRGVRFRVVDTVRAGDWKPRVMQPGEAVRIATGGALPAAELQVVMKEDVRVEGDLVTLVRRDDARNIRFRGEDARAGRVLLEPGTRLGPGALALLASLGCARPRVTRLPRVLHVATGNEIVPPEATPGRGQIRDSNSVLVRAFLGRRGVVPEQRRIGEDQGALRALLADAPAALDLLLISGGASVGEHDFTRALLEEAGFGLHVRKTTARPGKPLIVAQRGPTLAFGLPGNPLAHFVCLNLYVRTALDAWEGRRDPWRFEPGMLAGDLEGGGHDRETFWPAQGRWEDGRWALRPLAWSSSGDLTALATANALLCVAAGTGGLKSGARVEFLDTESLP